MSSPRVNGSEKRDRSGRTPFALPAGLAAILLVHLAWIHWNDAPPVWDMAYHQLQGYRYLQAWREGVLVQEFAYVSQHYPPLYYLIEAAVLAASGGRYLAFLANLPAIFLLCLSGYALSRYCLVKPLAGWASLLVLLFPMVAWVSRESLLDGLLAGWVAFAVFVLARSGLFQDLRWSLLFGAVTAAGMLTKWTFPVYLAAPVLYALWVTSNRRRAIRNVILAAALCVPFVLVYYGPNLGRMIANYPTTQQAGLIPWKPYPRHGEPGLNNLLGWIYYPRILAGYFLFLPLLVVFLVGWLRPWRGKMPPHCPSGLLWVWLAGGTVLLTFVTPKDPRFALPLALPLALLLLIPWKDSARVFRGIVLFAFLQFLTISFPNPFGPVKLALFERKGDLDFQTIQQEWVLYESQYFDVAGPPRVEAWPYRSLLRELPEGAVIGFLPDLPRFHTEGLLLEATRYGRKLDVFRIGFDQNWVARLSRVDHIVSKTGYQGISFLTSFNEDIVDFLEERDWEPVRGWGLPDGSQLTLWRRPDTESDAGFSG